jgi:alpha-glucosidase (family GH31 glycosyl hydrolase)
MPDAAPPDLTLKQGRLTAEITLRPFGFTIRRDGRRLLRNGSAWIAEGTTNDHFVQWTEGVVAEEHLTLLERAARGRVSPSPDGTGPSRIFDDPRPHAVADNDMQTARIELSFEGGRRGEMLFAMHPDQRITLRLSAQEDPLRLAFDWDRRSNEHFVGLGARHGTTFDQRGRSVQLGADRRYTGPDCPPEMLSEGGIPQGDCAPMPWMLSSRGYSVLAHTTANGTRFDMATERTSVSTRAVAGPLVIELMCQGTPAARQRALCRQTGFPMLLPEWGYGFWKSRDVHEDRDAVMDDYDGFRRNEIPLDAIVIDSPWATQYNSWEINPHQLPDAEQMIRGLRSDGVRTVLWCTPWVNIDSRDGQIPPQQESERLHREPAVNYAPGAEAGHYVQAAEIDEPWVGQWWMGTGSIVDFTSAAAEAWWREQVKGVLTQGVEGIKMDDGDGFYLKDDVRLADGRSGAPAAWALGGLHRISLQRALDEVHPGEGVLFGRSGWAGQQAIGHTWAADQASDFWSLRALLAATLSAAASGFSNWSHDVGGYLGHRLMERCPPELLVRWLQFGCFTPLMQAHSRMAHEPWNYGDRMVDTYRAYVLLHEQLVPYVRAAADTAARTGLPIIRPLCLIDPSDPRGWELADAYGFGPSLWVAPVLDDGAREREVELPRGEWIETWSGTCVAGGGEVVAPAPLEQIPVWVRAGAIVVTYPADHVARGLGDTPESERPLEATLWGRPTSGRASARLTDGTRIRWSEASGWETSDPDRQVTFQRIGT